MRAYLVLVFLLATLVRGCPNEEMTEMQTNVDWNPQPGMSHFNGDDDTTVWNVGVDEDFIVFLDANPTTGYAWDLPYPGQVSSRNTHGLVFRGCQYVPANTKRAGAGGRELWGFVAKSAGQHTVELEYRRSWEVAGSGVGKVIKVDVE